MNKEKLEMQLNNNLEMAAGKAQRKTYTEAEAQELTAEGKTQGRKGLKLARKNIGLTPDNYDYVSTMGKLSGGNASDFINQIIREHREAHEKEYAQAVQLQEKLTGKA